MHDDTHPNSTQLAAYHDQLISAAMPQWLRAASTVQLHALHEACSQSLYWRERCQQVLAQVQGIDAYCRPLLQQALQTHLPTVDEITVSWRKGEREPVVTSQPIGYPVTVPVYRNRPLLEAALTNFTAEQAEPGGMLVGNRLERTPRSDAPLPTPAAFAAFCRRLDLGARYQQHLSAVLEPVLPQGRTPCSVLANHLRCALLADAHRAAIKGVLDAPTLHLLERFCELRSSPRTEADPQAGRLRLLGYTLERILVIDSRNTPVQSDGSSLHTVVVYIPDDPHSPLRSYPSLRRFANDLGRRLRTADYQRFFSRFVRRRDAQGFFSAVIDGYEGIGDLGNISLDERLLACEAPVFDCLARMQIAQIKDDASLIATPVAVIDQQVQREHARRLATEGWTLLNLAALFVPAVGAALLAVTAWDILDETFQGVQAWREGEHGEALEHLFNVAAQIATLAVVSAGSVAVANAWNRSRVVDELVPLTLPNGQVRLGLPALDTLRVALPAQAVRDAEGLYRLGEQRWIELDGAHYAVSRVDDSQPWQLRSADGVLHPLTHNGAGAWRLWYEDPGQCQDPYYLFRRLSLTTTALDDEAIDLVLQATDTDADELRALHVHGIAADALLLDTAQRVALEARVRRLVRQLRGGQTVTDTPLLQQVRAVPEAVGLTDQALAEQVWSHRRTLLEHVDRALHGGESAHARLLLRDFPGLSRRCAEALVEASSPSGRGQWLATGRVPQALSTAAQRTLRRQRVARAYEGLFIDTVQGIDQARLAILLGGRLPGAGQPWAWRLFELSRSSAPVWVSEQAAGARQLDLVCGTAGFELFDGQGARLTAAPGELFETLAAGYRDADRAALGVGEPFAHNLRVLVARQAAVDRQHLAQWLGQRPDQGWFRVPTRLADGRLGYPLSGRSRGRAPRSLGAQMRRLYPLMRDEEVEQWAQQIRTSGRQVEQVVLELRNEMRQLESHLRRWTNAGNGLLSRTDRSRFAEHLLRAWRRMTPRAFQGTLQAPVYRLRLQGIHLPSLPTLPESIHFDHIDILSLCGVGLTEVGAEFLVRFPNLRVLELGSNALRRLPQDLDRLARLQELALNDNSIMLDAEQASVLSRLERVRVLDLSNNPLGRSLSFEGISRLRLLDLRNTELPSFPTELLDRLDLMSADLRGNRIATLPQRFFHTPRYLARAIRLDGNPFDAETWARLDAFIDHPSRTPTRTPGTSPIEVRDAWLATQTAGAEVRHTALWEEVRGRDGAAGLFDLLQRLQRSADFQHPEAALGQRVWTMLEMIHAHLDLGEALFELANLPLTCQDSATLCFSSLELHMLVWKARLTARTGAGSEQQALIHLGRQLWRLDEVERIALADIAARRAQGADPDQIEVLLAYRVGLREDLDLPAQPQDMLFRAVAGVDNARLAQAHAAVLAAEQPGTLARSLAQRDFWRTWLEQRYGDRLQAFDAPFQARMEALMDQAEAGASAEGDYLRQMNTVRDEREAGRLSMFTTLTEEILAAQTPQ